MHVSGHLIYNLLLEWKYKCKGLLKCHEYFMFELMTNFYYDKSAVKHVSIYTVSMVNF